MINTKDMKKDEKFYNNYATKKTFSNGLMDGALLATNASQLRFLLTDGFIKTEDPKWVISIILVTASIISQVIMLVILGLLANSNLANKSKKWYINTMNNVVLVLTGVVFCLNIITNVFIQVDFTSILDKISTTAQNWSGSTPSIIFNK